MEHLVALAFLNRLSDFEKDDLLREKVKGAIMQGQTGAQICRVWGIKPEPLAEKDTDAMSRLFIIWRKKRESKHLVHTELDVCECISELEDIHSWLNFANAQFQWPESLRTLTFDIAPVELISPVDVYFDSPQMIPHSIEKFFAGTCECQTCEAGFGLERDSIYRRKSKIDVECIRDKVKQRLASG